MMVMEGIRKSISRGQMRLMVEKRKRDPILNVFLRLKGICEIMKIKKIVKATYFSFYGSNNDVV